MKKSLLLALAAFLVVAAALSWRTLGLMRAGGLEATPSVLGQVPAFRLVDESGKDFDSASLAGRLWLASFLYTSCPGPCPRLVERLKGIRRLLPSDRLPFVSLSVDPATDTPAVLASYKAARGIGDGDAWTFLTGPADEMTALVTRGFVTGLQRNADGSAKEDGAVTHGVRVLLIDGQGRIRGAYATDRDEEIARLVEDVGSLD